MKENKLPDKFYYVTADILPCKKLDEQKKKLYAHLIPKESLLEQAKQELDITIKKSLADVLKDFK